MSNVEDEVALTHRLTVHCVSSFFLTSTGRWNVHAGRNKQWN